MEGVGESAFMADRLRLRAREARAVSTPQPCAHPPDDLHEAPEPSALQTVHVRRNREPAVAIFNKDMIDTTTKNKFYQKEVYLDDNCQIVMMNIEAGDDIGEETHDADQTTFFVSGEGSAVIDGHSTKVGPNHMIVIPKGAKHNIINKGSEPLKLFTVYSPPAEDPGVSHKTKAEAEEAEKD